MQKYKVWTERHLSNHHGSPNPNKGQYIGDCIKSNKRSKENFTLNNKIVPERYHSVLLYCCHLFQLWIPALHREESWLQSPDVHTDRGTPLLKLLLGTPVKTGLPSPAQQQQNSFPLPPCHLPNHCLFCITTKTVLLLKTNSKYLASTSAGDLNSKACTEYQHAVQQTVHYSEYRLRFWCNINLES